MAGKAFILEKIVDKLKGTDIHINLDILIIKAGGNCNLTSGISFGGSEHFYCII